MDEFFKLLKFDLSKLELSASFIVTRELLTILKRCDFSRVDTSDLIANDWKSISNIFTNLVKKSLLQRSTPDSLGNTTALALANDLTEEEQILSSFLC